MNTGGPSKAGHRLLVAVSSDIFCKQAIERARQLADSIGCPWLAVHVTTGRALDQEQQTQLNENLSIARELGGEVITTIDEDVANGLLRIARQHNATQIIVRKSAEAGFRRRTVLDRLTAASGDIDIHIVRTEKQKPARIFPYRQLFLNEWPSYLLAIAAMGGLTIVNLLLSSLIGYRAVALNYLLGIVLLAFVVGRGPMLIAATVSALAWNFLFLPPRFTFAIHGFEDAMMFAMYFVIAIVLGQLIAKIRMQEEAERRKEEFSTALYLLTRELAQASSLNEIVEKFIAQVQE